MTCGRFFHTIQAVSHVKQGGPKGSAPEVTSPSGRIAVGGAKPSAEPAAARPRAQVAYEGDDEFSVMSTSPDRRKAKPKVDLGSDEISAAKPAPAEERTSAWHFVRKIFGA